MGFDQRITWTFIKEGTRLVSKDAALYQRSTCFESGSEYCYSRCDFRGFMYSNTYRTNFCNEKALDLYAERAGANLVQVTRNGG